MDKKLMVSPSEGFMILNAGLVIFNPWFLLLLERLEAISDRAFISEETRLGTVHYLQYIVTGLTQTDESLLALNKLLCGISPDTIVRNSVEITQDQKQLVEGLIKSVIGYWVSIGPTSITAFRSDWMVREGILRETEEYWELTVEKRRYDTLLRVSLLSFSIIKLPWMRKGLRVFWV